MADDYDEASKDEKVMSVAAMEGSHLFRMFDPEEIQSQRECSRGHVA